MPKTRRPSSLLDGETLIGPRRRGVAYVFGAVMVLSVLALVYVGITVASIPR